MKSNMQNASTFKTLIVGADFSKHSKKVFENALTMAKQMHLKVVLAHIADPNYASYAGAGVYPFPYIWLESGKDPTANLENEMKRFYNTKNKKNVSTVVKFGKPADDLVRLAKKYEGPLIFVGHTEKGPLSRLALGSVSRTLAVKSPVPVWIQ